MARVLRLVPLPSGMKNLAPAAAHDAYPATSAGRTLATTVFNCMRVLYHNSPACPRRNRADGISHFDLAQGSMRCPSATSRSRRRE